MNRVNHWLKMTVSPPFVLFFFCSPFPFSADLESSGEDIHCSNSTMAKQGHLRFPATFSLFLLLPLKLPLLGLVSRGTPPYLNVRAAFLRAVGCQTHVRVRVVDSPVLQGFKEKVWITARTIGTSLKQQSVPG